MVTVFPSIVRSSHDVPSLTCASQRQFGVDVDTTSFFEVVASLSVAWNVRVVMSGLMPVMHGCWDAAAFAWPAGCASGFGGAAGCVVPDSLPGVSAPAKGFLNRLATSINEKDRPTNQDGRSRLPRCASVLASSVT